MRIAVALLLLAACDGGRVESADVLGSWAFTIGGDQGRMWLVRKDLPLDGIFELDGENGWIRNAHSEVDGFGVRVELFLEKVQVKAMYDPSTGIMRGTASGLCPIPGAFRAGMGAAFCMDEAPFMATRIPGGGGGAGRPASP